MELNRVSKKETEYILESVQLPYLGNTKLFENPFHLVKIAIMQQKN